MIGQWIRVTRANRCPVCAKDSWCCINPSIGIILCMREPSQKPSNGESGGWIHRMGEKQCVEVAKRQPEPPRQTIDATAIMLNAWVNTTDEIRQRLAAALGVSVVALRCLGVAWCQPDHLWYFPMFDGERHCIGIRTRNDRGEKKAVKGSRNGIFFPKSEPHRTVWIVEGASDVAAALDLGLFALGRPDCNGGIAYTQVAINRLGIKRAIITADNDSPGIRGAKLMADELQVPCCSIVLPCKDLREFKNIGGTIELLNSLTEQVVWHQPNRQRSL